MEILELKSTISEVKITLNGFFKKVVTYRRVSTLEDRSIGITRSKEQREKKKNSLSDLTDNINMSNMYTWSYGSKEIMGQKKNFEEIMAKLLQIWEKLSAYISKKFSELHA